MIARKLTRLVLDRDRICVIASPWCTGVPSCADHRVGRGMGGNRRLDVPENLVAACGVCNGLKESDVRVARDCLRRGLLLNRGRSTTEDLVRCGRVPVVFPDGSRWVLRSDGTRVPAGEGQVA
jgi:hypothetical protein